MDIAQKIEHIVAVITGNLLSPEEMEEVLALCLQDYNDPQGFLQDWEQQEGKLHIPAPRLRGSILQYNLVNHEHTSWAFATGHDNEEVHAGLQDMLNGPPLPDYSVYKDMSGSRHLDTGHYASWLHQQLQACRPDLLAYAFLNDTIDDEGGMTVFTIQGEKGAAFEQHAWALGLSTGALSVVAAVWAGHHDTPPAKL